MSALPSNAQAQVAVGTGTAFSQNFNGLSSSGTAAIWSQNPPFMPGWYAFQAPPPGTLPADANLYFISDGSSTTGGLYSFGTTDAPDRAFGSISAATTGPQNYGLILNNNLGVEVTSFHLIYTGEQWRNSGATAQSLAFDYRTGTSLTTPANFTGGGFTAVSALNFTSPVTGGAATALDGNAAANRTARAASVTLGSSWTANQLALRWTDTSQGNDHGLGLDDFQVHLVRNLVWTGTGATPGQWSTTATVLNWRSGSTANNALPYANVSAGIAAALPGAGGDRVQFTDAGLSASTVTLVGSLSPTSVAVSNTTGTYTFTGTGSIAGATSLTKTGNGNLVLATANTYSGGTVINGGTVLATNTSGSATGSGPVTINSGATLFANNSAGTTASGPVTVNGGGTLRGEGSIGGAVTVHLGATIQGGSTANPFTPLTVNNTVTVMGAASNAGTIVVDLNNTTTSGSPVSRLSVGGGALNFDTATSSGPVFIRLLNLDGLEWNNTPYSFVIAHGATDAFQLNGTPVTGYTYGADFTLGISNFPDVSDVTLLVDENNDLVLTFTPVPEPATVLGLAAAVLGLGAARRLRRSAGNTSAS